MPSRAEIVHERQLAADRVLSRGGLPCDVANWACRLVADDRRLVPIMCPTDDGCFVLNWFIGPNDVTLEFETPTKALWHWYNRDTNESGGDEVNPQDETHRWVILSALSGMVNRLTHDKCSKENDNAGA